MTEVSSSDGSAGPEGSPSPEGKGKGVGRLWLAAAVVVVIAVAVLYVMRPASFKPGGGADLKSLAQGQMVKLVVTESPRPAPTIPFTGPDGAKMTLADFPGQVVVVNFWATWCAPCVTEMPSLAKLQAAYPGKPVKIVAISLDRPADEADARRFLAKHGPLTFYADPAYALPFGMSPRIAGVPTTIIYDRSGKERARLAGGADWSGKDARAVIDAVLAG